MSEDNVVSLYDYKRDKILKQNLTRAKIALSKELEKIRQQMNIALVEGKYAIFQKALNELGETRRRIIMESYMSEDQEG